MFVVTGWNCLWCLGALQRQPLPAHCKSIALDWTILDYTGLDCTGTALDLFIGSEWSSNAGTHGGAVAVQRPAQEKKHKIFAASLLLLVPRATCYLHFFFLTPFIFTSFFIFCSHNTKGDKMDKDKLAQLLQGSQVRE